MAMERQADTQTETDIGRLNKTEQAKQERVGGG